MTDLGRVTRLTVSLLCGVLAVGIASDGRARRAIDATQKSAASPVINGIWRPVVRGRLENGLRFAILPRRSKDPGMALLVRIEGGFLAEERPGQRGLAHLIEHLALISPTKGAPDELRRFVRIALPLTLPAPSAGTTSWSETNYFLATRTKRSADLDTLLALFREVVSDMTFRADAVDDQRADVMREMSGRQLGNDVYARYIAAVAPGSPTDLIDAQNSDDVPTASIATIRALYHRLYRPENTMIVVVGAADTKRAEAMIQRRFGGWKGYGPASARTPIPTFQSSRIPAISYSDLQQGRSVALMTVAMPEPPAPPTRQAQIEATLLDMTAMQAVTQRLVAAQPTSPPGKSGIFIENGEQGHRLILLWDNFANGLWRPAIMGLKTLTCNLGTVGMSEGEWATAREKVILELERRTKDMADLANVDVAKDLSHAIADGRALVPPNAMLRYARGWLPTVGARAGNAWWRRQWYGGVEHIRVESPELAQIKDPRAAIRAAVDTAIGTEGCVAPRRMP